MRYWSCENTVSLSGSVASFFVSRVDTQGDKALGANGSTAALALRGKIAIANAKSMYRRFREIFHGDEFSSLRQKGARVQRPLWASTGTKNRAYSGVLYVEELVGPDTVNTIRRIRWRRFAITDAFAATRCLRKWLRRKAG
jgi:transaldolase